MLPGQVSWLAGLGFGPAFPGLLPVTLMDHSSPLTVAGAAPALPGSMDEGPSTRAHRLPS